MLRGIMVVCKVCADMFYPAAFMDEVAKEETTSKFCRMELILIVRLRLMTHRNVCFDMFSPAGIMDGVVIATVPLDAETDKSWTSDYGLPQSVAAMTSSRLVRAPSLGSTYQKVTASSSTSLFSVFCFW